MIDDFVIQYCLRLKANDFTVKSETLSRKKMAKREYLDSSNTKGLMSKLDLFFASKVDIAWTKFGKRQMIETLTNEEALLLDRYLRDEQNMWIPRNIEERSQTVR